MPGRHGVAKNMRNMGDAMRPLPTDSDVRAYGHVAHRNVAGTPVSCLFTVACPWSA